MGPYSWAFLLLQIMTLATAQQSPVPRSDQGPYLLHFTKDPSSVCLQGAPNMINIEHKSCSKTSFQQFYYSPNLAAFKLGKKCLGLGTVGGLQLLTCPDQMNQNFKAMWTCASRERQCCVADNDKYCVIVKDGTSWLPTWLPDVDMGSTSGIWKMVLYFIVFTLFLDAVLCGVKIAIRLLAYLMGFLQKQEPELDVEAADVRGWQPTMPKASETRPLNMR